MIYVNIEFNLIYTNAKKMPCVALCLMLCSGIGTYVELYGSVLGPIYISSIANTILTLFAYFLGFD